MCERKRYGVKPQTPTQLVPDLEDLRARLDEAEDTLRAIRSGEVDALVVSGVGGEQVYTLKGADHTYRLLIEEMSEGALTMTAEGVILYANRRFAEMVKTPLEQVIGSVIHTWIAPGGRSILSSLPAKGDNDQCYEQRAVVAGDGTLLPVNVSMNSLQNDTVPGLLYMVVTDLSEQKRAEATAASEQLSRELLAASDQSRLALLSVVENQKRTEELLRQSEEKFSKAFQTSPYAITITHAEDGRYIEVNDAFTSIAGYTREEALADSSIGLKMWVNEADRQRVVDDLRAGRAMAGHEYQFRTKSGKVITGVFSAQIIKLSSGPRILSSINDITGRKQADTDLRIKNQVFEDSVASQSIVDKNGVITYVNPAFLRLWGYATRERAIGNSVDSFFAEPDDARPVLEALAARDAWEGEFRARRVDGTTFISRGFASSLRNTSGELIGYQSTNLDVTHEREAQEEILQLNEQLCQKAAELEQVVCIASHDLRSPLVNVQGFSKELGCSIMEMENLLRTKGSPEAVKSRLQEVLADDIPETLHFIQSSIAKMDTLLAGLLTVSRIGRVELTLQKLDMNSFIKEIAGTFRYQFADKGISFGVSDLPVCRGDKGQISQVFSNIIDNAIKYGDPKRPGRIHISGKAEKDHAVFCVEDNGIGIAREHAGRIFEMFRRLNPADTSGEGLGLAIVQRILLKHKGRVQVESEVGKGSRFFIELPRGRGETVEGNAEKH